MLGLLAAGAASAPIDLATRAPIRLLGAWPVAAAGDFNGDGWPDVVLGNPQLYRTRSEQTGGAYVVFGGPGRGRLDVGRLGDRGVRILGAQDEDMTGSRVAGVGDVNGDGLSDVVVVGARAEAFDRQVPGSRVKTRIEGAAYVVFGRRDPGTIDLRSPGSDGFVIRGVRDGDAASAGDFNGDGRPDVVVGQPEGPLGHGLADLLVGDPGEVDTEFPVSPRAGAAYVVLGRRASRAPTLIDPSASPFVFGGTPRDQAGSSLAAPGDFDGDGHADLLVAASPCDGAGPVGAITPNSNPVDFDVQPTVYGLSPGSARPLPAPSGGRGTPGSDILVGGPGPDRLVGGGGPDCLFGDGGSDRLAGGPGADVLFGEGGGDRLYGGPGPDILHGGPGADVLVGGPGSDGLDGGPGNDRLVGGSGRDSLFGGDGNDVIVSRDGHFDVVDCGKGRDRVIADRRDSLTGCEQRIRG